MLSFGEETLAQQGRASLLSRASGGPELVGNDYPFLCLEPQHVALQPEKMVSRDRGRGVGD